MRICQVCPGLKKETLKNLEKMVAEKLATENMVKEATAASHAVRSGADCSWHAVVAGSIAEDPHVWIP